VIVVGAGIAGLSAALRLSAIGWQPTVLERAPARRREGHALHLFGLGYTAAERMGLLPALREREFGPLELIVTGADGRPRFTVGRATAQAMFGDRNLNLMRTDVEAALYEAVAGQVPVRFGRTVSAISQDGAGVRAVLDDGSELDGDLLVGADGRRSAVRRLLFPGQDRLIDLGHTVAAFAAGPLPGQRPGSVAMLGRPGRTINIINPDAGRALVFLAFTDAFGGAGEPREVVTAAFGDLGGAIPAVLAAVPERGAMAFDRGSEVRLDAWSRSRIVLLGDAAWLPSAFAGYGASLAMGGADLLATALSHDPDDVPAALREWERELRPEVELRQRRGRASARRQLSGGRGRAILRELPLRIAALPPVAGLIRHRGDRPPARL
jgi:2-polyprenyl-6-methoxyphenol hydroxylase-like FAD-dependent oxidoreductase